MSLPGHGETIGEAYIRILADGSHLSDSTKKEFAKRDKEWADAGKRRGRIEQDAYDKELSKEFEKSGKKGKLRNDLLKQLGRFDATSKKFADKWGQDLYNSILSGVGQKTKGRDEIANIIFGRLRDRAFIDGNTKSVKQQLKNFARLRAEAIAQLERMEKNLAKAHEQALKENERRDSVSAKNRKKIAESLERDLIKLAGKRQDVIDKLDRRTGKSDNRRYLQQIKDDLELARKGDREAVARLDRLRTTTTRLIHDGERGFIRLDGRIHQNARSASELEKMFQRVHNRVEHLDFGKAFGKGSRNNFINFVGSAVGAMAKLGTRIALFPFEKLAHIGTNIRSAFADKDESFVQHLRNLGSVLIGSVSRGLRSVAKLGPLAFGGLAVLQVLAGPLAAAVSMLGGAISAVLGSAVLGLIGGIGALLPIMGVFAVGLGVLASAFAGMTLKQKQALKVRMGPLIKDFSDLRKVSRNALFSDMKNQVPALHHLMTSVIQPLFRTTGRSIATSLTSAFKVLAGPTMKKNWSALQTFAPQVIKKLGIIFTNTFTAMTGIMRAAIPVANRFLDSLVKASAHWSKFINSTRGQNRIKEFLDKSYTSGTKLWQVFRNLVKVLKDIFEGGQSTGDSMLDSLNKNLVRFDNYLNSGRGRKAMQNYFNDVRKFVSALGKFGGGLARLFGALDNEQSRQALNAVLTLFGGVAKLIATALPDIIPVLAPVGQVIGKFFHLLADNEHVFGPIIRGLTLMWLAFKVVAIGKGVFTAIDFFFANLNRRLGRNIGTTTTRMTQAGKALSGAMIGIAGILAGNSIGGGKGLAVSTGSGIIGGALLGSAFGPLGTGIGAAIGGISGVVSHFWSDANKNAEAAKQKHLAVIASIQAAAEELRGSLEQDNNSIKALTKGLIAAQLQKPDKPGGTNALLAGQRQGIDPTLIVNSAAGSKKDFAILNAALIDRERAVSRAYEKWKAAHASELASGALKLTDFAKQNPEFAKTLTDIDLIREKLKEERTAVISSIKATDLRAESLGKLSLATRDINTQTFAYGHVLLGNSVAARRNQQFIADHTKALGDNVSKMLASGKSAGVAAKAYLSNRDALQKQLIAAKFSKEGVQALLDIYGKVPKSLITKLAADPTKANEGALIALAKLHLIPKSILTQLTGTHSKLDDATKAALKALSVIPPHKNIDINATGNAEVKLATIKSQLNNLKGSTLNLFTSKGSNGGLIRFGAAGGILNKATFVRPGVVGGEAGREALVPLQRPLSQVDPSVRALSAFAQGLDSGNARKMASGGIVPNGPQRVVTFADGAIRVITPTTDPVAVAAELINRIAAGGYG